MSRLSRFIHFYTDEDEGQGGGDPGIEKTVKSAIVHITDALAKPAKKFVATLEPIQSGSGDPSPENVRPITGHTGCEVYVTGINIWDEKWEVGLINASNGQNTESGSYSRTKNYIPVVPNASYYFKNIPTPLYLRRYGKNKEYSGYGQVAGNGVWNATPDTYYLRFCWDGTTYNNNISLNHPSTDTNYHTGSATTIPITLPPEAGTVYGGTLTYEDGVWSLVVDRAKIVFDGTQAVGLANWRPNDSTVAWLYSDAITPNIIIPAGNTDIPNIVSDTLKTVWYGGNTGVYGLEESCISIATGGTWGIAMRVNDTSLTTSEKINAWLASNPVTVIYEISTPTTYTITEQQVLTLLRGDNNIWCDASDSLELTYYADGNV